MRRGRPKAPLELSSDERDTLERWAERAEHPPGLAERARILLACAAGETNKAIAARFGLTPQTVGKWRARFLARRLDGLLDEPRSGAPRRILDADVQRVLTLTLETQGPHGGPWSTRSLAQATGLSQSAVSRIWRAHGIRPYRGETSRFWHDPGFVEKVRDLVGVYADPPTCALALCVSACAVPSVERVRPANGNNEMARHVDRPAPGSPLATLRLPPGGIRSVEERRASARAFRGFLERLDERVPRGLDAHVLMARDGTLESSLVQSWLAARPRFQAHALTGRASFEDLVERWLTLLSKRQAELERDPEVARRPLERAAAEHRARHGDTPAPFSWTKATDEIIHAALTR